jgi:hypothetical protein
MQVIANPNVSKLIAISKLVPGFLLALIIAAICFSEWFTVGVFPKRDTIAQYPFGSEAAMEEGGWYYRNTTLYARIVLIEGVMMIEVIAAFTVAAVKRTATVIATAYGVFALWWVVVYLITHQQVQ